ncbi:MAG: cytochrome c [Bryobacteraceae bacterium]|jgi:mono/diheme cytochrome c family protein
MKIAIVAALLIGIAFAQDTTRSVWDGVYTAEQASRGQSLYNQHCSSCHADTLTGGEMSPPLAGGEFMSNWNGLTLGDLFERIRTTMPQNKAGKLSREVNADITAYILNVNKFPAGKTELAHSAEFLKEIRIESEKK